MKFRIYYKDEAGKLHKTKDVFDTREEAETFIGIEMTQMEFADSGSLVVKSEYVGEKDFKTWGPLGMGYVRARRKKPSRGWHKHPELHAVVARRGWEERRQRLGR